jgi:hypothetical protein
MILVREASSELGKGFSAILNWTVHFLSSIWSEYTFVHTVYEVGLPAEAYFYSRLHRRPPAPPPLYIGYLLEFIT